MLKLSYVKGNYFTVVSALNLLGALPPALLQVLYYNGGSDLWGKNSGENFWWVLAVLTLHTE